MKPITVVLADDHRMLRDSLRSMLQQSGEVEVVGEAQDGNEALELAEQLKPDVVVMDIAMPNLNGIIATRQIRQSRIPTKVVILTMYETDEYVSEILKAGASGYVTKDGAGDELLQAIRVAAMGAMFLPRSMAETVVGRLAESASTETVLTARETQILQLITRGMGNRALAASLNLSLHTVRATSEQYYAKARSA